MAMCVKRTHVIPFVWLFFAVCHGRLQSLDWTGGLDWTGLEWTGLKVSETILQLLESGCLLI